MMIVRFKKESERQYSITVANEDGSQLRMSRAPGYDPWLPHDLQHLIVEKVLNLGCGVFGQLEAGGTAGTFHRLETGGSRRERSRRRRALKKKGASLAKAGQIESERSERATIVCLYHWMKTSRHPEVRAEAEKIRATALDTLEGMISSEREVYTPEVLDDVAAEMERLSSQWRRTRVGGSLEVVW